MSATITAGNGAGVTHPLTILSPWETRWVSRNVVHDLIGGDIAVSLVTPRPRAGSMRLLYPDEAAAFLCAALHEEETTFSLVETDRPHVSMTYVVDGEVAVELDEETLTQYVVTVGYQAVTP